MTVSTLAIVNPLSNSGATGRRWQRIETLLRATLGTLEVEHTRGPRDAERIAREAARSGFERLVVVGGDGTANEVATGLLSEGLEKRVQLGVLPVGTGGDLARELHVPRDMMAAVAALGSGGTRRLDAGRIEYRTPAGGTHTSYFVNVASFGLSGRVDMYVRRVPRRFGGTVAYLLGSLMGLANWRSQDVRITLDGREIHAGPIVLAAAANGGYFGGGMHIAPLAEYDDGLLDLVVVRGMPTRRVVANMPSIYRGTHVKLPEVSMYRGRVIAAEPLGHDVGDGVWLDVDGDPLGSLPARIEVLPDALTLFGARADGA